MADYVHGIDTVEIPSGNFPVTEIRTAIVGVVGTAPRGAVNSLVLVKNITEAAQFGKEVPGFTIPQMLSDHFKEGGGWVLVGNVYSVPTMVTPVEEEVVVLSEGLGKTAFPPISNVVVKSSNGVTTFIPGTDYSIDEFGNIKSLKYSTIAGGATLEVSYNKQNLASVTATEIIGSVDPDTGVRTGMKMWEDSYNLFTFEPKILEAPGFSHIAGVAAEMAFWSKRLFATALVDAPPATTVAKVAAARGPLGDIPAFNVSDPDVVLCFPELLSFNPATKTETAKPFSQFLGGLIGRVDKTLGTHYSPSNKPFRSAKGVATSVSGSFFNSDTDANYLNSLGIVTVLNEGTAGLTVWGNESSWFPANADPFQFISVRRTIRMALRSIQLSGRPFIDLPIEQWVIDSIRNAANAYIRSLVGRGALLPGSKCIFDKAKNPPEQIAAGRLVFTLVWLAPSPLRHLTFESDVDVTLNSSLTEA